MFSRSFVSALSLLRGSESRIIASPVRNLSALTSRASLFRPGSCVVGRSLSNQPKTASGSSGSHVPSMHHVSSVDRISLILTRTMKPPIPAEVHTATMERANSRRRIGINVIMGTVFLVGAIWIIKKSQKGREEHTLVSLHEINDQRYGKLREEEAATAAAAGEAASGK